MHYCLCLLRSFFFFFNQLCSCFEAVHEMTIKMIFFESCKTVFLSFQCYCLTCWGREEPALSIQCHSAYPSSTVTQPVIQCHSSSSTPPLCIYTLKALTFLCFIVFVNDHQAPFSSNAWEPVYTKFVQGKVLLIFVKLIGLWFQICIDADSWKFYADSYSLLLI